VRKDQLHISHWEKADMFYPDYVYAKFNVTIEKVSYSNEEYDNILNDNNWSRDDTDLLVKLHSFGQCMDFELIQHYNDFETYRLYYPKTV
jgi:DNA methyltransferase 1-associated protein 1